MLPFHIALHLTIFALACSSERVTVHGSIEPEVALTLPGATRGVVPLGLDLLAVQDGIWSFDPVGEATDLSPDSPCLLDAARVADALLLATDEGLYSGEGYVDPAGFPLEGVTALAALDGTAWLADDRSAHRWREGQLSELSRLRAPIAVADGVLFARSGRTLVRMDGDDATVVRRSAPKALSADGDVLWVVEGGDVWRIGPDGEEGFRFDEAIVDVHAGGGLVWVIGKQGNAWLLDGGEAWSLDATEDWSVARADELGRLLVPGFNVERWSVGRPIVLLGLEDLPSGTATVEILPEVAGEVVEVLAFLDGEDLEVSDWKVSLSSSAGEHLLSVEVDYDDGSRSSREVAFEVVALGEATWSEDIEPLYVDHCAVCHSGDTETALDTPELWEDNIEDVVANLQSGAMPLGRDPLTGAQIATVEAWRDGGFQP